MFEDVYQYFRIVLAFSRSWSTVYDDVVKGLQCALHHQETAGDEIKFGAPDNPPEEIHAAAIREYNKVW